MQVDTSMRWKAQQPRRKNLSVCDHDDHVCRKRGHEVPRLVRFQRSRLVNRETQNLRQLLDGWFAQQLTAPARFIRLGNDGADRVTGLEQSIKRRRGERCATEKDEPYSHLPWRISFLIRRLIMSRLMKLRWSKKNLPSR